ncbi:related to RNase III domain protein [Cephalotrichum gorgonifer]|uniref:Related to RNase III domain protein n=1 Tax=Cephalotrichum gorgonifer TaxID=2041049 RepID=A0AAE8MU48_9PEZI|nr:related to RNase III domain protein [Cephalotrichum gorgonifer]
MASRPACRAARLALNTSRASALPARQPILATSASPRWLSSSTTTETTTTSGSTPPRNEFAAAEEGRENFEDRPRWSYTPPLAKAPFSIGRPKNPKRSVWTVNEDPAVLDKFYERFLGSQGAGLLPEELKWLAVTHKSFDQGRRGFNDRLAYFGRQAIIQEVTKNIISSAEPAKPIVDPHGRQPFQHPALAGLDHLVEKQPHDVISREKMHKVALEVGLLKVLRWKPRLPENLAGSGVQVVLTGAIHAIFGAISLQHGAEVTSRLIQEKLLKRLA